MTYVIEGTISELSVDKSDNLTFKISGTEGYAIRQRQEKFNLWCPETLNDELKNTKGHFSCIALSNNYEYTIEGENKKMITQYGINGTHFKFTTSFKDKKNLDEIINNKPIKIESITIFNY